MKKKIITKIKSILKFILEAIIFVVAWILILPITLINIVAVAFKYKSIRGYFLSTASSIDRWGNREFRTLWNLVLINKYSNNHFGSIEETISSVLGKNQRHKTLTLLGKILVFILDKLDKDHCKESINDNVEYFK